MYTTKVRSTINGKGRAGDETIRRVTKEKVVVRGNTTIRTLDSTTSFLPLIERFVKGKKTVNFLTKKIDLKEFACSD